VKELKTQFINALLVVLTVAAVISAVLNFQQQKKYRLPEDGVTWVARKAADSTNERVVALHVVDGSSGARAGIRQGDTLLRINGYPISRALEVTEILIRLRAWAKPEYEIERRGVAIKTSVVITESEPDPAIYYQYIVGAAYLAIGLFVYFRRGKAPKSRHFYILCLTSFVLCTFHYTGKLNGFDQVIYWGNVGAGLFAPTIFLHFCLTFPERRRWFHSAWRILVVYLPAVALFAIYAGIGSGILRVAVPLIELRWLMDRVWLVFLAATYLCGAAVLEQQHRRAEDPIVRHQLRWLRNGALLGILPFTLFYVLPYALGSVPGPYLKMAVLSLPLVPLTWAYAIVRYRLMDVDIIFQQGYVYTLATVAVLGIVYGLVFSLGNLEELSPTAVVFLIFIATFVFQPIRNWIQELLDRYYFYKDRYDYRSTLIEFARELSSETDLPRMLGSVADRLVHTLSIQNVAFFVADETGRFRLEHEAGRPQPDLESLDLSFLTTEPDKPYLFFERTRYQLDVVSRDYPNTVRKTISQLDLTYYLPCTIRNRTIAYLGVGRTSKGDFLSSDDVELLTTLCGYVGIALENARLYHSLQRKVEQYERLKEFSENIVESINVGILAADLQDRVESWNSQIEKLTGISRERALGRRLSELFPSDLCEKFESFRGETGIHHVYKFVLKPDFRALAANGNGAGRHETSSSASREAIVNLAIAPLISKDYEQIGRLIIFDDVTDRAELERRLVQADKLSSIGLLAAGVAHEVNTPLAVISTYAQMLAKQVSGDEQKSKLLEKIAKQTFRASEIVNSLLNFSRTSSAEFVEVDLNKVIRETISLIEHQLQKAHIEVKLNLEQELPLVKGNQGKLQQVFLNLFLNARDAMELGGILAVSTHSNDSLVRVDVADSGQGIPKEHLQRIYDPFFTTKPARKGTGLGLSVSYGIVQEHGGAIEVQSQPGAGTRFHLDFPLARKPVNA
jgi:signal transduction histidine kinase